MLDRYLLIDGDILIYRACSAVEKEMRFDEDFHFLYSDFKECLKAFEGQLKLITKELKCKDFDIAISSSINFRKDIYPEYKAQRTTVRKPLALKRLQEHVLQTYNAKKFDGIEADDILGILATTKSYQKNRQKIIVSIDKDFNSVPGSFYNYNDATLNTYTEYEADVNLYKQAIMGDRADNYLGIKGVGDVFATNYLREIPHKDLWKITLELFLEKGYTEEYALQMVRCARILRASDWDAKTKTVKLFTPKVN